MSSAIRAWLVIPKTTALTPVGVAHTGDYTAGFAALVHWATKWANMAEQLSWTVYRRGRPIPFWGRLDDGCSRLSQASRPVR